MKVFSYVVVSDTGFAPNPFHGFLTLACCKPRIRHQAKVGDWVIGTVSASSKRGESVRERLLYAAKITEVFPYFTYWSDPRFEIKKPKLGDSSEIHCGDNIYDCSVLGSTLQIPSFHSTKDGTEDLEAKAHDLNGVNVLASNTFIYFGDHAVEIPGRLSWLRKHGQGHKSLFTEEQITQVIEWLRSSNNIGDGAGKVLGKPLDFEGDLPTCLAGCLKARRQDGEASEDED